MSGNSTPGKRPHSGGTQRKGSSSANDQSDLTPATNGIGRDMTRKGSVDSDREAKKKRISLSCAQCAKRKQKCNREFPCNHCISRKVPELCVPYNPGAPASSGPDPATTARIDRLETVLSFVVRHHGGLWGYPDVKEWMQVGTFQKLFPSSPSGTPRPYPELGNERDKDLGGREIKPLRASGSNKQDLFEMEQSQSAGGDEERLERLGEMEGLPESMESRGKVNIKHDVHGTPAENLQQLIRECGMSPHKLAELVQELPPKQLADKIVNWFFSKLNFARYPIDERSFRESYEDLYNRSTAVDPSNVRALPLVFIVLALAVRLAPEEWAGNDETRKLSSLRMYWSSRRSILVATAVQSESIELVLSRLLSAMYLVTIHDRRLTECWSQLGASLRTAQAIGLHRDGAKLGLDPHQSEYRRRIWSYLYHADKLYSLVLGRPPSISDSYTDTLPPSNLDLSSFHPSHAPPTPLPLSQPTTATFLILRRSLSTIVGNVVHHFQKLDEPAKYSDVEALQVEMDRFIDGLPGCFRMYDPDKSMDDALFWLPVHRFSLLSEIIMTTIILHRPWLLRRLSSNRYAASRTACFEMAKLDFALRTEHYKTVPDHKVYQSQGQFKMFNSAMIAGISAIIDPRGPDGDTMRKILGTFLELNPWIEVKSKDETTRKEVRIIQTLSRRAAQIYEKSFAPGELSHPERDSVGLLLGLREDNAIPPTPLESSGQYRPKGWANLINNNNPREGHISPGSSDVHEDDSQRMLDHWLNANSSLAVGSLTSPFPLDLPTQSGFTPNMGPPTIPGPMGIHHPSFSIPNTPMGPPPPGSTGRMSWNDLTNPNNNLGYSNVQAGPSSLPPNSIPNIDFGMGDLGHGGHGHGHGHTSGEMMFDPSLGMAGMGVGGAAGYGLVGVGDMPVPGGAGGTGENADEYWNALIDGILGTTGGMGSSGASG